MKQLLVYFLLVLLIIFRYFTTRPVYRDGDRVRITSTIYSDPIKFSNSQYLKISGLKIYLPPFPEVVYGDTIIVEGVIDDKKLKDPEIISISERKTTLSSLRKNVISFYQKTLPEPSAGLIAGITLGSKGALTQTFWESVKKVGAAHIVVASGTNVTFVTSFLISFLSTFLSRRKMILFAILGIVLYLFISGFDAPLIRAGVMSGSMFFAQGTGRLVTSSRLLILTGLGMLVFNPEWITDIGFILSFISTASLILFQKRIDGYLHSMPNLFREGLSTSLAAQIGVAPILFVTFGQFNILSPIINALILWTVPYIMILGAAGGAVGVLLPFLGKLILWAAYPLTWWFIKIVQIFE